ncbi:MAG TPA: hypothetical protein P5140_08005 [Methanofastidiosum sp.]|nr:hypothetical protein [Methanofastidiosum sp.]
MLVKRSQLSEIPSYIDVTKVAERCKESEREFKSVWKSEGDHICRTVDDEVVTLVNDEKKAQLMENKEESFETGVYYPAVTRSGDRLLTTMLLSGLQKDLVKTDFVKGLWTLPIEILYGLKSKEIIKGFSSKTPGLMETATFFLSLFGESKLLSDGKTRVIDVPAHRWWEALHALLENEYVELFSERKIEKLKV